MRPHPVLTTVLVALAATCSACGGGDEPTADDGPAPGCTPMPTEPVVLSGDAARFDLTGVAEPTRYVSEQGYLVINARSERGISDLGLAFVDVVTGAGFDIAGLDDEGFEAEVFFSQGDVAAGMVVLTESPCPGFTDVRISVLDDPAVLPDGDSSPSAAPPG